MDQIWNGEAIDERFLVRGRMEVRELLDDLIHRCEPVTVRYNDVPGSLETTLLEAKDTALIFELSEDADGNQRLLTCAACTFTAYPDGIPVQFSAGQVNLVSWDDSDAFSVALPEQVARLQRQQNFRTVIPLDAGLTVKLFADGQNSLGEWPLHNLSVGGLGVTVNDQWRLAPTQTITRAIFVLPGYGEIASAVMLRHETGLEESAHDLPLHSPLRIGLAFVNLPPGMGAAIQRYIIRIEHERRSAPMQGAAEDDR